MKLSELKTWIDATKGLDDAKVTVTVEGPSGTTEREVKEIHYLLADNEVVLET